MDVEITHNFCIAVKARGEVDVCNIDEFSAILNDAAKDSHDRCLIVDLSSVTYIDGAGIKEVLRIYHTLRSLGGTLAVVPSKIAKRILDIIKAHELPGLVICEDIQKATEVLLSYKDNIQ